MCGTRLALGRSSGALRERSIEQQHRDAASDQRVIEKLALTNEHPGDHAAGKVAPAIASDGIDEESEHDTRISDSKCNPPSPPSTAAEVRPDNQGMMAAIAAAVMTAMASVEKNVSTERSMSEPFPGVAGGRLA